MSHINSASSSPLHHSSSTVLIPSRDEKEGAHSAITEKDLEEANRIVAEIQEIEDCRKARPDPIGEVSQRDHPLGIKVEGINIRATRSVVLAQLKLNAMRISQEEGQVLSGEGGIAQKRRFDRIIADAMQPVDASIGTKKGRRRIRIITRAVQPAKPLQKGGSDGDSKPSEGDRGRGGTKILNDEFPGAIVI